MLSVPELLDSASPEGIEVWQLTTGEMRASHIYMEAHVFTPDSKRLVLQRGSDAHGFERRDNPDFQYLLCDLENDGELIPLSDEINASAMALAPAGDWFYYFVDDTRLPGPTGDITLKRVSLDGLTRETLKVIDAPLPGMSRRLGRLYPISTISSDGKRLVASSFLGTGLEKNGDFCLLRCDLETGATEMIHCNRRYPNPHTQYCRSTDPEMSHDLLVQHDITALHDEGGWINGSEETDKPSCCIHVIRDDGTNWRDLAWGRHETERCQGHQCWIGQSGLAVTSNRTSNWERHLIAGKPVLHSGHDGMLTPGGIRNNLTRDFAGRANFYHFQTDRAGKRMIADYIDSESWQIYVGDMPEDPLSGTIPSMAYLLTVGSQKGILERDHPHPFLSPDGSMGFFNGDHTGVLHAYMVKLVVLDSP